MIKNFWIAKQMYLGVSHFDLANIKTYKELSMSGRDYRRRSSSPIRIQVVAE